MWVYAYGSLPRLAGANNPKILLRGRFWDVKMLPRFSNSSSRRLVARTYQVRNASKCLVTTRIIYERK